MQKKIFLYSLAAIYLGLIVQTAWVSDDAFITFRTIENFVHSYGLVFNVGERVQTFTHPLWLIVQTLFYVLTDPITPPFNLNHLFFINLVLSISLSLTTVLIFAFGIARSTKAAIFGLLALILSKSFIDYSTSGLENPLNHLLIAGFMGLFMVDDHENRKHVATVSLLAGLAMLNRLDTLLIILPPLFYLIWESRQRLRTCLTIGIGLSPIFLWEIFSIFYYGFLFPNTAYAKLNVDIDSMVLLKQGVHYFINSFRLDPITLSLIGIAILGALCLRKKQQMAMAIGIILYLAYILYIGGDFMSGRYFSLPFLIAIIMLSKHEFSDCQFKISLLIVLALGVLPFLWGIERRPSYGDNRENNLVFFDDYKIADERLIYAERTSLLTSLNGNSPKIVYTNEEWNFVANPTIKVEMYGALGISAYRAGPNVHTIDRNGLADPLMARLPLMDTENWRIGHFHHIIPEGYLDSLENKSNSIEDPNIAKYYDRLSFVIKGPLWNWNRIIEIWLMNTGKYNHLLG